jgi:hypothetical protein
MKSQNPEGLHIYKNIFAQGLSAHFKGLTLPLRGAILQTANPFVKPGGRTNYTRTENKQYVPARWIVFVLNMLYPAWHAVQEQTTMKF